MVSNVTTATATHGGEEQTTDHATHSNRRRLSKRERKALKNKKSKKQKTESEVTQGQPEKDTAHRSHKRHAVKESIPPFEALPDQESDRNSNNEVDEEEQIRLKCLKSYIPVDIPKQPSADFLSQKSNNSSNHANDAIADEGGCRTLGKWFPNAILVKSSVNYTNTGKLILLNNVDGAGAPLREEDVRVDNPKSSLVLFYQYTTSADSTATAPWDRRQLQLLMTYLSTIARRRNLGGRIRVAPEGVNATISAVDTQQAKAQETLRHFAHDLQRFDPKVFTNTDFKYLDHLPADRHFKEFKILPVQELVFYDIGEDEAPLQQALRKRNDPCKEKGSAATVEGGGVHLDAKEYHKMLQKENAVVIDVRNHYETILGRFDGQQIRPKNCGDSATAETATAATGAEYIDPRMRKSTDFKTWLASKETQQKLQNKTVLMYCTGGIRCERASAYLKSQMGDQVEGVYQLKGGIERYLKTFKDGGFWRGKNFVFDKREAVGVENPEGDGGVIRKQDKTKQKKQKEKLGELPSKCCVCGDPWDRYVGKKKCSTCGVPVLMCDKCMSLKPDKTPGMELKVRCPLCVEENITVLAREVEFTANGIKNKVTTSQHNNPQGPVDLEAPPGAGKAADSVLKWGGGHANKKRQLKKMKRRLCQFGKDCVRQDCFFYHPERESCDKSTSKS